MTQQGKSIAIAAIIVVLLIGFIILINRCSDDENDEIVTSEAKIETEISDNPVVEQPIPEYLGLDSILRHNIDHDTTKMYELPHLNFAKPQEVYYRFAYTVSFNPDTRIANWVAWSLTSYHTDGPYSRKKLNPPYYEDVESITNKQFLTDWRNEFPYEHGHMCPAGDNKWDEAAMRQSFFLSNMCPQHGELNQGDWQNLEDTCRKWAKDFGEIFIVAGPIFETSSHKTLPESSIAIPDKFFKVVLCLSPKPMAIGFVYPNDDSKHRFFEVAKSIDYVEKITGIDFFYLLDDETENQIESSYNLKDWHLREK